MTPLVSVVLVTRNGMATLPAVVAAVRAQRGDFEVEIVAVDSESTDGTAGWLRTACDRFASVPAAEFDHGLTRNLAIELARGERVALLVQDAEPADPGWLSALLRPLEEDPRVAASFARQLPRPDASPAVRRQLAAWVAGGEAPRCACLADPREWERLSPLARLERAAFDNVSSCLRRSVWRELPFPRAALAEDLEWARAALLAGWAIAYAPAARVWHSHRRGAGYELRRTYLVHRRLHELFGVRTVPSLGALARAAASNLRSPDYRGERRLAVAWPLGQWLGGWAAAHRVGPRRLAGV